LFEELVIEEEIMVLDGLYKVRIPPYEASVCILLNGSLHGKAAYLFQPFDASSNGTFIQPSKQG